MLVKAFLIEYNIKEERAVAGVVKDECSSFSSCNYILAQKCGNALDKGSNCLENTALGATVVLYTII